MANPNDIGDVASGVAALSVRESLPLAMGDLKIMNEEEAVGANGYRNFDGPSKDSALHIEVEPSSIVSSLAAIRFDAPDLGEAT